MVHNCVEGPSMKTGDDVEVPVRPAPVKRGGCGIKTLRLKSEKGGEGGDEGGEVEEVQLQVLVVEDNLLNQKVLVKSLKKEGFGVCVANHGGEALEFLKGTGFWAGDDDQGSSKPKKQLNLILMDLEMPVMDGITCVKQIREWERERMIEGHVPILAVTANARKDQIMSAIDAGMDDVTTKPYRIQDMLKQIGKLVRKYCENRMMETSTDARTLGARMADLRTRDAIEADSSIRHDDSGAGKISGSSTRNRGSFNGRPWSGNNTSHAKARTRATSLPNTRFLHI